MNDSSKLNKKIKVIFLILFWMVGNHAFGNGKNNLSVITFDFQSIEEIEGRIFFMIVKNKTAFDSSSPSIEDIAYQVNFEVTQSKAVLYVGGLKPGKYAAKFFHDLNGNGNLDFNSFKIPTEPYGFSNNAKGLFGPPKFKDAIFEVDHRNKKMKLKFF